MATLYWHDYETWGATPSADRPSQFAGVRTDEALNIVSDPLVLYCKPPQDMWPQPLACLITGITPQQALRHGVSEKEFMRRIHRELSQPKTCGVGYNSIRFDDEITRYSLYRNYYDPYEREWKMGNSRWDIIDMVRLVHALRPESVQWPEVDGVTSFKLENLSAANGLAHRNAHDAYSDVEATIALAKLIKQAQPKLYEYVWSMRSKAKVAAMFDLKERKPLLHISSKISAARGCAAIIAPIAMHPVNRNAVIVMDLASNPAILADLTVQQIRERIFTSNDDLAEKGLERLSLKLVHFNKCPIVATVKLMDDRAAKRLHIDMSLCEKHWHILRHLDIAAKLQAVFSESEFAPRTDPEQRLYDGFISDGDKALMRELRKADANVMQQQAFVFNDGRLNTMFLRYKARNFPEALNRQEVAIWQAFVRERLENGDENMLSREQYLAEIARLDVEYADSADKLTILRALKQYAIDKAY